MFNKRKRTEKQDKKATAIILGSIKPFLQVELLVKWKNIKKGQVWTCLLNPSSQSKRLRYFDSLEEREYSISTQNASVIGDQKWPLLKILEHFVWFIEV